MQRLKFTKDCFSGWTIQITSDPQVVAVIRRFGGGHDRIVVGLINFSDHESMVEVNLGTGAVGLPPDAYVVESDLLQTGSDGSVRIPWSMEEIFDSKLRFMVPRYAFV
jgi:hypothetical protein